MGGIGFIVRNEKDVAAATRGGQRPLLLCTRRALFASCRKAGSEARLLHEDLILEEFEEVNVWSLQRAVDLVGSFASDREKHRFFEANFLYIQRVFVQAVKFSRVLAKVLDEDGLKEIRICDDGRSLLAIVCDAALRHFRPGTVFVRLPLPVSDAAPKRSKKERIGEWVTPLINWMGRRRLSSASKKRSRRLLASGGMHHLSPVLEKLQKEHSFEVVYAEQGFNLEKLRYCFKNRAAHLLLPGPGRSSEAFAGTVRFQPGQLIYRGMDVSGFMSDVFEAYFKTGAVRYAYDESALADLYKRGNFDAVLLDEDIAMHRMIGVFSDKDYFVITHGTPAGLSDDPVYKGRYRSGITFSASEFERREYERLYYDLGRVRVTGVPRYDRIAALTGQKPESGLVKNILHCGASMKDSGFEDNYALLGLTNFLGEYSEKYLRDLIELTAAREDVFLKIKPHYAEEAEWEAKVPEPLRAHKNYRILSHKDDTFALEAETDLLISTESSVVCEAIMLEKPVIVLNYTRRPLFSDYTDRGLVEVARNREELKEKIQKCLYDAAYLAQLAERRRRHAGYFHHSMDGRSAERVAAEIARSAN